MIILYLVACSIITANFKDIFADIWLYMKNMFIQTDMFISCYGIPLFSKNKYIKSNMQKIFSYGVKQDEKDVVPI